MIKLGLQLIPQTTWCNNLRKQLGNDWTWISQRFRRKNNWTCQYCGWKEDRRNRKYTHLHEVWEFDLENKVQKLTGFECLCPLCHSVHHWGFAEEKGDNMDDLMVHACEINNCTESEFRDHIRESFQEWRERSLIDWKIDTSNLKELIPW